MKTYFAVGVAVALLLPAIALGKPQSNVGTCNTRGSFGYHVYTSAAKYHAGSTVTFCLVDDTRLPLFFGDSHPWEITNASGAVIFTPPTVAVGAEPPPTFTFSDSWNGLEQNGTLAPRGTYHILFPGLPGQPSATFTVKKH